MTTNTGSMTIRDIFRYGPKKIDTMLPFIIFPALLLFATISLIVTIIIMIAIGMAVLYVQSRPIQRNRSPFFFSWTLSSCIYMFLLFELKIVLYLEITLWEHITFLLLLINICYFFNKMKATADFEFAIGSSKGKEYSPVLTADSQYCQICQIEVNDRFFHSIWLDCCIFRPNYIYYLLGQVFALITLLVGSNLSLTTICVPYTVYYNILLPRDCSAVYYMFGEALCFAGSVYCIGYAIVVLLVLIQQLFFYIPKYSVPQWKKLRKILNV